MRAFSIIIERGHRQDARRLTQKSVECSSPCCLRAPRRCFCVHGLGVKAFLSVAARKMYSAHTSSVSSVWPAHYLTRYSVIPLSILVEKDSTLCALVRTAAVWIFILNKYQDSGPMESTADSCSTQFQIAGENTEKQTLSSYIPDARGHLWPSCKSESAVPWFSSQVIEPELESCEPITRTRCEWPQERLSQPYGRCFPNTTTLKKFHPNTTQHEHVMRNARGSVVSRAVACASCP